MSENAGAQKLGLLERLDLGPVICAEGYLFEIERRGYLQAGAFVPEVVLEHPELVENGEGALNRSDPPAGVLTDSLRDAHLVSIRATLFLFGTETARMSR